MAIPGLPNNLIVQDANRQILVSWDLVAGATSYIVQRSQDNITFSTIATISGTPLATQYLDTTVAVSTQYYYIVAAANGSGQSSFTTSQSGMATSAAEMTLSQIRLAAQQRADRVNSNFVSKSEWRTYINQAMYELYDLLVTTYEDYFVHTPISFIADGNTFMYELPNGTNTFTNALSNQTFTPKAFYKLLGVDLGLQTANNAYVTVNKFNFADRNRFVFPNTASTIYGVFNLQYRLMGNKIEFIPTPSAGQIIRIWYIPRLTELLLDTDTSDIGISGWLEYVIVRAAKYALDKEEADTQKLDAQILFLKQRIEDAAANRDEAQPNTISNVHKNYGNGFNGGWNSGIGGF